MKPRIFIGLASLVILLMAMGAYAVWLFARLGSSVDVILRENYPSVLAGQQMKESAERMDSALVLSLVGEEASARKIYDENLQLFQISVNPAELLFADTARSLHEHYAARAETFWQTRDLAARRSMYFSEMLPLFTRVEDAAEDVIRINQKHMVAADRETRSLSARSTRNMALAVLAGIVSAVFFAWRLQRSVLPPIPAIDAAAPRA
jgi:NtrC-family two-component system sensor histidine kinase KinB